MDFKNYINKIMEYFKIEKEEEFIEKLFNLINSLSPNKLNDINEFNKKYYQLLDNYKGNI